MYNRIQGGANIPSLFDLLKTERKVCIMTTNFPPYPKNIETFRGGVTEVQEQLYNELVKHNVDVFVISFSLYGISPQKERIYRIGTYIPYSKSKVRRLIFPFLEFFNPLIFFRVIKILIKERPSSIEYASLLQGSIAPLVASVMLRIKVIVRTDWLCPNLYAKSQSCSDIYRMRECAKCLGISNPFLKPLIGLYSIMIFRLKRFLWNRYCMIIVQSNYHKNLFKGWGVNPDNMIMIPPTSTIFEYQPFTDELIRLKGDKIALAYVGRLSVDKGFDLLLESFKILRQKNPYVMLLVAGSGALKTNVENVVYLGWVEKNKLGSVYKVADIVVVPTIVPETHPAVVDDAIKYGKKIVAFKVGALEEMVGSKGIFCDSVSAESLNKGMIKAVDSLKDK